MGCSVSTHRAQTRERTILHRFLSIAALAAIILLVPAHAVAGSFRAMPLRLYIDSKSKTEVLRVVNEGDESVTVQIDAKSWSHDDDGRDSYGDAPDIVVFPRMATIDKGETQIIRIGYSGAPAVMEKTYRLFVQELPVSKPGEMALKFALTMSLPVFVAPDTALNDWSAEAVGLAQESLQVKVKNSGNRHVMVNKIKATGLDANGAEVFSQEAAGWYTLAGQSRLHSVNIPYQECLKATRIRVEVRTRESSKELEMPVNKKMCTHKPENTAKAEKGVPTRQWEK